MTDGKEWKKKREAPNENNTQKKVDKIARRPVESRLKENQQMFIYRIAKRTGRIVTQTEGQLSGCLGHEPGIGVLAKSQPGQMGSYEAKCQTEKNKNQTFI